MKIFSAFLVLILLSFSLEAQVTPKIESLSELQFDTVELNLNKVNNEKTLIRSGSIEIEIGEVPRLVYKLQNTFPEAQIVVSSNEAAVYQIVEAETQDVPVLLLNKEEAREPNQESEKQPPQQGKLANYRDFLNTSIRADKTGAIVTLITTGVDVFVWLHTGFNPVVQAGQALFSVTQMMIYGFNKAIWTRTTQRVADWVVAHSKWEKMKTKKVHTSLMAITDFLMGAAILSVRMGIIVAGGDTALLMKGIPDYSVIDVAIKSGSTAFIMAAAFSISSFGWGLFIEHMDRSTNAKAQYIARRWHEIRNVIMSYLSPSAKLMSPSEYGFLPWISVAVNGTLGLSTFILTKNYELLKNMVLSIKSMGTEKVEAGWESTKKLYDKVRQKLRPGKCKDLISSAQFLASINASV